MRTRIFVGSIAVAGVILGLIGSFNRVLTQSLQSPALVGKVTSEAEGAMEGVLVTARREGSTITTTVVSNAEGQYHFPRNRMEPGKYFIAIRAVGYVLPSSASVVVTAQTRAQLDLILNKAAPDQLASQLTSLEWFQSMPGTAEQKDSFVRRNVNCVFCHTMEKIVRSRHSAEQWIPVIQRMATYDSDKSSGENGRVQALPPGPRPGINAYGVPFDSWNGAPVDGLAKYLATINLSGNKEFWSYPLTTLPRPKGRSTRVVVTVYPIPRQPSVIHDIDVDSKGNVWYGNSGWDYIGMLDPKNGTFSEWPIPRSSPPVIQGALDVQIDPEDNLWVSTGDGRMGAGLAKFTTKTATWTGVELPSGVSAGGWACISFPFSRAKETCWSNGSVKKANGESATAAVRINIKTGKADRVVPVFDHAPPGAHRTYGLAKDSKDNAYYADRGSNLWESPNKAHYVIRIDGQTGEVKFFPTPTPNAFPRRGSADHQDRFWVAEFWGDNIAMLDANAERVVEFPVGIKYISPYFAAADKNGHVWASSLGSDRVLRLKPRARAVDTYLMPEYYDSRKVVVDRTDGRTIWAISKNTAKLLRIEPLD